MELKIQEEVKTIGGWPTDTVSIDYVRSKKKNKHNTEGGASSISDDAPQQHDVQTNSICPHTLLLFVPGNPGCVGWYTKLLYSIVERLGVGYAARGVSYAGHGVGERIVNGPSAAASSSSSSGERAINAHSVDGQAHHKILWMDRTLRNHHASWGKYPNVMFLSHSIGAHLVQRLCVLRPDLLSRVLLVMHLMPFIRFDPSLASQSVPLSVLAHAAAPAVTVLETVARVASKAPKHALDWLLKYQAGVQDEEGRDLAVELCRQPAMARNFLALGLEEVRTLPEVYDDSAMRIIGAQCATSMLYCGGPDQWAPATHLADISKLQRAGRIPKNITVEYMEHLKHDFVVNPKMLPHVSDFCIRSVLNTVVVNDDHSSETVLVTDGMGREPTSSFPRSRL